MRQQPFASPGEVLEHKRALGEAAVAKVLEHYGVKGMRWGVRKKETGDQGKVGMDPVTAVYIGLFLALTAKTANDLRKQVKDRRSDQRFAKQNANVAWKKKPELSEKAPPLDVDSIFNSVVKPTNPNYPQRGSKMNCRRCTFAYEMRRRGYDVHATPSHMARQQDDAGLRKMTLTDRSKFQSPWGREQIATPRAFDYATPERRSQMIFNHLGKQPDGARGELGVAWLFGGGHSMAWEVVRGKPVIFDTQTREKYTSPKTFNKFAEFVHDAAVTRTDNIKLNDQLLREWAVNHA